MMRLGVKNDSNNRHTEAAGGGRRKRGGFLRTERILFAVAFALVPLTTSVASAHARPSHGHAAAIAKDRPKICFVFGPWKYCI
jgi:hypothetical protein